MWILSDIAGVQGCSFCVAVVIVVSFGIVSLAFLAKALVAELGLSIEVEGSDSLDNPESVVH